MTDLPRVGEAFPSDDEGAQWAMVMALVANDLTRARAQVLHLASSPPGDGSFGYFLRVLIGHLLEGTSYLLACRDKTWAAPIRGRLGVDAVAAENRLEQAWAGNDALMAKLRSARNATFHYGPIRKTIREAIDDYEQEVVDPQVQEREEGSPFVFALPIADAIGLQAVFIDLDLDEASRLKLFELVDPLVDDLLKVCLGVVVGQMQLADPNFPT